MYISAASVHEATDSGRRSHRLRGLEKPVHISDLPWLTVLSQARLERDRNPQEFDLTHRAITRKYPWQPSRLQADRLKVSGDALYEEIPN